MKIQHPAATPGTPIGIQESARKYGVVAGTLSQMVSRGEIKILQRPARHGDKLLLDEASLQERLKSYTPHKDSSARRIRVRRAPRPTSPPSSQTHLPMNGAGAPEGNGHGSTTSLAVPTAAVSSDLSSSSPSRMRYRSLARNDELTLPLVEEYLAFKGDPDQENRDPKTIANYRGTLVPFAKLHPRLTWDNSDIEAACRVISPRTKRSAGTMRTHYKNIRTFYYWLSRRKKFPKLDLTKPALPEVPESSTFWTQEQMAQILHGCEEQWERCILITLAQTGARREEFESIQLANFHEAVIVDSLGAEHRGAWACIPSKKTKANKTGQRVIYLPWEATMQIIHCMGGRSRMHTSRGPLNIDKIDDAMRKLIMKAGLYRPGVNCHSFRHTWSAEYLENGGQGLYVDPLLGHFQGDMTHKYLHFQFHLPQRALMQSAFKFAPRRFLQMALDLEKAKKEAR